MDRRRRARGRNHPAVRGVRLKAYVVGGAVRDELLGLPLADRDWVVVGATPEEMAAAGYKPVGKDFPVFLHPQTHEEYALARTERKSGRGYKGFTVYAAPDVRLEEDLRRRDLTINAMAKDEAGQLVDPFQGQRDLRDGILRHVSDAFTEDPVRILRVARFAARFGFEVAPETLALMKQMVASGEAAYLVPERVWQEFGKGLAERKPRALFEVLEACGYLEKHLFELRPDLDALERAARANASLPVRFALLAWSLGADCAKVIEALAERIRVPNEPRELALAICRAKPLLEAQDAAPARLLELLKTSDAFRRPERFASLLEVVRFAKPQAAPYADRLARALEAARSVDAGAIAGAIAKPADIPARLDRARENAIAEQLK